MEIVEADSPQRVAQIRELFQEYWDSFGFTPCFQHFDEELAALPGACEMKRLYVRPPFRGQGVGIALVRWIIEQATTIGYTTMFADTMPVMQRALAMYDSLGFQRIDAYAGDATPGAVYLELALR